MNYQVLARKWRPKSFATLVGQEHVVRALSHALSTGRLHHAYLFTGTRGVGKTTISRILAKALNCETGVTATPCGVCEACRAIDADRFPDYVEMDAASNRGVDDMAALLDKAVYAPVAGRYKVYMIDEVHMLTGHAFNAMLKTLEEPPEHVKFILATTDPQKIPVTVLSRCLQFNLKQMPQPHIIEHLSGILQAEGVPFEQGALRHLAKAANGSMRDALSLLDQAIAHGAGQVVEEQVIGMLGTVGEDHLYAVLDALIGQDVNALLAVTEGMEARSLSFDAALQSLASLLHRIALVQMAPQAVTDDFERERLAPYAAGLDAEFLQLAYQIAIHGRDELPLAPDEATGFSMTLLRLFAFRPEQPAAGHPGPAAPGGHGSARHLPSPPALKPAPAAPATQPAARPPAEASPPARPVPASAAPVRQEAHAVPPWEDLLPEAGLSDAQPVQLAAQPALRKVEAEPAAVAPAAETEISMPSMPATLDWHATLRALGMGGMVRELAQHCELAGQEGDFIRLRLSHTHRHLLQINRSAPDKLQEALAAHFGRPVRIAIEVGDIATETPAQRNRAEREQRHAEAVAALEEDPFVRELFERFDATLVESSVKPFQPQEAE